MLFIVDEASGVDGPIIEGIESMLSNPGAKLLMIGNPLVVDGPFIEAHESPLYNSFHISCLDHPNVQNQRLIYQRAVSPTWPAERKIEWANHPNLYRVRVEGLVATDDPNKLIRAEDIDEIFHFGPSQIEQTGPIEKRL